MNNNTIRIVAAVVDTRNLTLYKEDGTTILIPQGDSRLRRIIDIATPQLIRQNYADISLVTAEEEENTYAKFEEQGNGLVRFFRVAKAKLKELMLLAESVEATIEDNNSPVPPLYVGQVPNVAEAAIQAMTPPNPAPATPMMKVIDEIIQHAVPAASPEFHENGVHKQGNIAETNGTTIKDHPKDDEPETIIAVVGNKAVIPGVEKIKSQFSRAIKMGSTTGVENFLKRLGTIIEKRGHSVDDLLKFMERADMPIAEDGSILVYKVLRRRGDRTEGKYVDCHTNKIEQWTGAYVCMDEKLVDHNRNNECSNGLHIARRGYIRDFSGDVCVLAKLAPEDVITVPTYDANKMRVCGYHILSELTENQYNLLKSNKPITDDPEGRALLAAALTGRHVRRTHEVRITGQRGEGVMVKDLTKNEAPPPQVVADAPAEAEALQDPIKEGQAASVNPVEVVKEVEQVSRKDQAKKLYDSYMLAEGKDKVAALATLMAFKKAAKIGWERLGIPNPLPNEATVTNKEFIKVAKDVKKHPVASASKKVKKTAKKLKAAVASFTAAPKKVTTAVSAPAANANVNAKVDPPRQRITKLRALGQLTPEIAQSIVKIKQQAKKSWAALGVDEAAVETILVKAGLKE